MKLYNNHNIKVGDFFIVDEDLYEPSNGILKGTECVVMIAENDYVYFETTDGMSGGSFDIDSQNADKCSLLTRKNRDEKIKNLLDGE